MRLNELQPAEGAKKNAKRVGRGIGSGVGKTAGRGHKGQKSRTGGKPAIGFEGGQMPVQRRIPKVGFSSRKSRVTAEIRLHELKKVQAEIIDLAALKAAHIIRDDMKFAKIIASGEVEKPFVIKGIRVTAGARKAIEAAGGKVETE